MKSVGRTLFELSRYNEVWTDGRTDRRTDKFITIGLPHLRWRGPNYFFLYNFGDVGAKMPFFHYIIHQKRNNFIKHARVYKEDAGIRDVYLYKKLSVQVGSWYTGGGGGTMFYRHKFTGVSAHNTQNTL